MGQGTCPRFSLRDYSKKQAEENYEFIKKDLKNIPADSIKWSNPYKGSQLYILLDDANKVLYVGETGSSLYDRIIGHGYSSHHGKAWYKEVSFVSFIELPDNKFIRRKWENEVSIVLKPVHND